ncbi:ribonuclease T2 [Pseudovibrio exalbescens]|uniref:ribonuclease T2 n=1 Tax=Pseudovibrio exalbescens TaxID=197461 RepID=UPI0015E069C9|nr:ribonuclease T2 [Pseudovibrio exalbescens]
MKILTQIAMATATSLIAARAGAQIPLDGYFVADEVCPAYQSLRKQTNPGDVFVEPDHAYQVIAKNKEAASHYLVRVKGADPSQRWVEVECGVRTVVANEPLVPSGADAPDGDLSLSGDASGNLSYVLAVSWQPGFCETRPSKLECQTQTALRLDAENFSLHGLWPQPRDNVYCEVPTGYRQLAEQRHWDELPTLDLSEDTRRTLSHVMPGTASYLHRYEWVKHGTCFGPSAEAYYRESINLLAQVNLSQVRDLFVGNLGEFVSTSEIRQAFDKAFGRGAGQRVSVVCAEDGARTLITELRLHLKGELEFGLPIARLMGEAEKVNPGCDGGIVDVVGLQ